MKRLTNHFSVIEAGGGVLFGGGVSKPFFHSLSMLRLFGIKNTASGAEIITCEVPGVWLLARENPLDVLLQTIAIGLNYTIVWGVQPF